MHGGISRMPPAADADIPAVDHVRSPGAADARAMLDGLNARAGRSHPVRVEGPLALYGGGDLGRLARSHLDVAGVPIACVVDRNAAALRDDPFWRGHRLVTPEEVEPGFQREALLAVSIVNSRFAPLRDELRQDGWRRCVPFYDVADAYRDRHPLGNGWFAARLDPAALADCRAVLDGLHDDRSRAHHLRFAAWRLGREDWHFADAAVVPAERYFIPEIAAALTPDERVLDVGAHHGTYLARLVERCGSVSAAWMVEPDGANRAELTRWIATLPPDLRTRIQALDLVIGGSQDRVCFHEGLGYASQIAGTGQGTRELHTIDSLDLDPTILKLHIEGGEGAALEGAEATIRRHRPIIMATVYHNADGLSRTPLWLMRRLERYRVLLRQHNWCGTGVVAYAIPQERFRSATP